MINLNWRGMVCGLLLAIPSGLRANSPPPATQPAVQKVSLTEFDAPCAEPDVVVLDVRTPKEFAAGHVPGAVNIDWHSRQFNDQVGALDKSKKYVVHCMGGVRTRRCHPANEHARLQPPLRLLRRLAGIRKGRQAGGEIADVGVGPGIETIHLLCANYFRPSQVKSVNAEQPPPENQPVGMCIVTRRNCRVPYGADAVVGGRSRHLRRAGGGCGALGIGERGRYWPRRADLANLCDSTVPDGSGVRAPRQRPRRRPGHHIF